MPIQPHRTRSLARVKKKTPSGRIVIHYRRRKPAKSKCAICKKPLQGVPRDIPSKIRKLSKTQKRPERPYGGYLCHSCLEKKILQEKEKDLAYEKIEPGRLAVKLRGREAGKIAVILEKLDDNFVLINGQVRRRKCNINHLAILKQKIKITKKITKQELKKKFEELGYDIQITKPKPRKERPKKQRKKKIKQEKVKKEIKKKEKITKKAKEK